MHTPWCPLSNALTHTHSVSLILTRSPSPCFGIQTFFTVRNVLEEKWQRQGLLISAGLGFKHHTCVAFLFRCRSLFISPSKVIHKNVIIVLSGLCQLLFGSVVKRIEWVWGSDCVFIRISTPFWPVALLVRRTDVWCWIIKEFHIKCHFYYWYNTKAAVIISTLQMCILVCDVLHPSDVIVKNTNKAHDEWRW